MENDWTEENVLRLIKIVQQYPCIWDPKDKDKKNTNKKREVYRKIAAEFEGKSPDDIRKKFAILLQCYRLYRRKVERSKLLANDERDIFQPNWFAFKALHEYMENNYTPHPIEDRDTNVIFAQSNGNDQSNDTDDIIEYQEPEESEFFMDEDCKLIPCSVKNKEDDAEYKISNKRKLAFRNEEEEIRTLNSSHSHVKKKKLDDFEKKIKDECDLFAQLLAVKLKKLDERTRMCLMNEIDNLVFKTSLRHRFPTYAQTVRLDNNVNMFNSQANPYDDPLFSPAPTPEHSISQIKTSPK